MLASRKDESPKRKRRSSSNVLFGYIPAPGHPGVSARHGILDKINFCLPPGGIHGRRLIHIQRSGNLKVLLQPWCLLEYSVDSASCEPQPRLAEQ